MNKINKPVIWIGAIVATSALLAAGIFMLGAGQRNAAIGPEQREAMETVVRDYLLKNPAVIRDAMQALQVREDGEKEQRAALLLKRHQTQLLQDPRSPVGGNPNGDITVVEFFDYNCGYCKKAAPALEALLASDAMVRVVYKEFPILSPQSAVAATAALAAGRQGKYAAFHSGLMALEQLDDGGIIALAKKLGLNMVAFEKDRKDPVFAGQLVINQKLATELELSGTPAFVVGGRLIPGALDAQALAAIVNEERAKQRAAGGQAAAGAADNKTK